MSELWTCANCGREVTAPDDPEHTWWELVEDPATDDPEQWPVFCPHCLYTPEQRDQISDALSRVNLTDAEKETLAASFYEFIAQSEGRN